MLKTARIRIATSVAAFLLVAPASALAANRYAGVGGSTTDPSCTDQAHPCDLAHVVKSVGASGDDVTVEPGTYNLAQNLDIAQPISIHGEDGFPRPQIELDGGVITDSPQAPGAFGLRYLDFELGYGSLFFGHGTFEQLTVDGGSGACTLGSPMVFRDIVCANERSSGAAVFAEANGGTIHVDLRNVTALATETDGVGIHAGTQALGGAVTLNLFNTIALGAPTGAAAAGITASTGATGTATINTNHSDYVNTVPSGPGAAINTSVTDQHSAPVFQAGGTWKEASNSTSTRGKGAVDPESGPLDFEGDLRAPIGTVDIGADQYTPFGPVVTGLSATGLDDHATVTATIDTAGSPTTYSVHYGPTTVYASASATFAVPAAATPQLVSIPLNGLTPGATYNYVVEARNTTKSWTSSEQSFTGSVTPPPTGTGGSGGGTGGTGGGTGGTGSGGTGSGGSGGVAAAPLVGALALTHTVFIPRGVRHASSASRRHRSPIGTRIAYTDSQPATTTLTVARRSVGVLRVGRCVAPPKRIAKHAKRCTRFVKVGSFTHRDAAGLNRVTFNGRLKGRALRPGSYRLTAVPVNAAGKHGQARTHGFTIARS